MVKLLLLLVSILVLVSCTTKSDNADSCGDGIIDVGEECDGEALGGASCTGAGYYGGHLACNSACALDWADCQAAGRCGDDVIDEGEECDGSNLAGESCDSLSDSMSGPDLACNAECQFDTSQCVGGGICGNDYVDPGEECEGDNLKEHTCGSLGYYGGDLSCGNDCQFDESSCETYGRCGDSEVQANFEECDGDTGGLKCTDIGYYGGESVAVSCTTLCEYNRTPCAPFGVCGDNVVQSEHETCDGTDLGAETCISRGYHGGEIACDATACSYDLSDCIAVGRCGDDVAQSMYEECDGSDLGGATCRSLNVGLTLPACVSDCSLDDTGCNPVLQWGSTAHDTIFDMALLPDDAIIFVGSTTGVIPLATGNQGGDDAVYGKISADGSVIWAFQFGSAGDDSINAVASDANGDFYVAGTFSGGTLGTASHSAETACLVAKYSGTTGTRLWETLLGESGTVTCDRLVVDSTGNVFALGTVDNGIASGTYQFMDATGVFAVKFLPGGTEAGFVLFESMTAQVGAMAIDSSDTVYAAVNASGGLAGVTSVGGYSGYVFRFQGGSMGIDHLFTFESLTTGDEFIRGMTVDDVNHVLLFAGSTTGDFFGITPQGREGIVGTYGLQGSASAGTIGMTGLVNGAGENECVSVLPDPSGGYFVAARINSDLYGHTNEGTQDLFIIRLNTSGYRAWHEVYSSAGGLTPVQMLRDGFGNLIVGAQGSDAFPGTNFAGGLDISLFHGYPQ